MAARGSCDIFGSKHSVTAARANLPVNETASTEQRQDKLVTAADDEGACLLSASFRSCKGRTMRGTTGMKRFAALAALLIAASIAHGEQYVSLCGEKARHLAALILTDELFNS